jgi:hypothetical protein
MQLITAQDSFFLARVGGGCTTSLERSPYPSAISAFLQDKYLSGDKLLEHNFLELGFSSTSTVYSVY